MSSGLAIIISVLLLAGNAFFVGAEFALISARRSSIEPLAENGSRSARRTLGAMEQVSMMLAGAQLGITVCSLGLGALAEPAIAQLIEPAAHAVGLPDGAVVTLSFLIAISIVVYLHMVLGEMVPKNIALAGPDRSALALVPALSVIVSVLKPAIWILNSFANGLLRILRVHPKDEITSSFTADEVAGLIAESRREGLLEADEHRLLQRALTITRATAGGLAMPMSEVIAAPPSATPRDVQDLTAATGYSRFPISDGRGGLGGYVHVKDTLLPPASPAFDEPIPAASIRPLPDVGQAMALTEVVDLLQSGGSHIGRVIDASNGAAVGVIALEDVLEELIGEVNDAAHT